MIEKLDIELTQSVATNHCIINKINELVEAVNTILSRTYTVPIEDIANVPQENKFDQYAEQRRWIGKLCRFWDSVYDRYYFDTLKGITDEGLFIGHNGVWKHCEPVKADSDIIYKGDNNEK